MQTRWKVATALAVVAALGLALTVPALGQDPDEQETDERSPTDRRAEHHAVLAEALAEEAPTPLVRIGLQDRYAESGSPTDLYEKYGQSGAQIATTVRAALSKKR